MNARAQVTNQHADESAKAAAAMTRDTYDGAELRPFAGRPAAMDAFALPSRMFNRLHYRDGRVERVRSLPATVGEAAA